MAIEQQSASEDGDTLHTATLEEALAMAVSHHQEGDTEIAETIYRSILAAVPDQPDALQFLGVLLHGRGESREGAAMLREATRHAPENAGIWTNLGNVLHASGQSDAAVEAYRRAVEIAPGYPAPHSNLGTVHRARNELAEAEAEYVKALELDPHFADAWHNLAVVMLATRRFHQAVQSALRSIVVSPEGGFPRKLVDLAKARRQRMENAAAIFSAWLAEEPKDAEDAAYRQEIERDAGLANSWHNLAVVMLATRHFDEAARCGLRAASLDHNHRLTLRLVGHAHAQRGQMDKAAAVFRSWLAEEPGNPMALHYLAACEGKEIPARASDAYVETTFDSFAASFDEKLASLDYRAPGLVAAAVRAARGAERTGPQHPRRRLRHGPLRKRGPAHGGEIGRRRSVGRDARPGVAHRRLRCAGESRADRLPRRASGCLRRRAVGRHALLFRRARGVCRDGLRCAYARRDPGVLRRGHAGGRGGRLPPADERPLRAQRRLRRPRARRGGP